jgi:hypothetical protein
MKIETILDAMIQAWDSSDILGKNEKRDRQYDAFRNRIIRMDEEKDARIKELEKSFGDYGFKEWIGDD